MPGVRPADVSLVLVKHVQGDVNWRPAGEVLSVALEKDEICWSNDTLLSGALMVKFFETKLNVNNK